MSRATAGTEASRSANLEARARVRGAEAPDGAVETRRPSKLKSGWSIVCGAAASAKENNVTMIAQALAYSFFLAIPSICLVVLGVFSLVASPADVRGLVDRAGAIMPAEATSLLRDSLERGTRSAGSGVAITLIGFAIALWSTMSAATALMQGVTTAFGRDDDRGFVRKRLLALLLVGCFLLSALLVVGLLVFGPYLSRWIGDAVGAPGVTSWLWWTAQWPILIGALLFLFAVLLYVAPDVQQPRWRLVTPGAAVAVLIWLVVSGGFAFYAAHFGSYNKTWGTLSAVVVTLVWLWLTSAALLFGAEINATLQRKLGRQAVSESSARG
jgi:membrane protein